MKNPRVFISYAHELDIPDHRKKVLQLAQALRLSGVDATIDQFVEHDPPPHWPGWMIDQIKEADFVLCVASPLYKERVDGKGQHTAGLGARWEGLFITEELYNDLSRSTRFIAVVLDGYEPTIPHVLRPLGSTHYYWPSNEEDLYRRITKQPRVIPAQLGPLIRFDPPLTR
ncbi:SEFIR domain-containing protein [Dietzia sp. Die43]|uniref:SEFIR domain-containing protein n=1 Tax=Dietzia sp. Die43 TaxID=2926011 RepID=UPI0035ABF15A